MKKKEILEKISLGELKKIDEQKEDYSERKDRDDINYYLVTVDKTTIYELNDYGKALDTRVKAERYDKVPIEIYADR